MEEGGGGGGGGGGGEQSSLAFKGTCTETGHCEQSCFWLGKNGVV